MKKRAKNAMLVWGIILGFLVVSELSGILFGDGSASQRLLNFLSFIAISLAVSLFVLNDYFRKSLGRAMRSSPSRESVTAPLEEPENDPPRSPPVQPFAYQVFDKDSDIEIGPDAATLLQRGYRHYRMNIYSLIAGALYLLVAFSIGSVLQSLLDGNAISITLCCGIVFGFPISLLVANPRYNPSSFTTWVWRGWNIILFVSIAFTALSSVLEIFRLGIGALLLSNLATGVLAGYGILMTVAVMILRRDMAAQKPLRFLALWVFNFSGNLATILSTTGLIWQFLGSTQYLRGGGFTVDIRSVLSKRDTGLVDTPKELKAALQEFHYTPIWSGRYKVNSVLCGDAVWKLALHTLLRETDVVVMSLMGFTPTNQGCRYELSLLVDRLSMQRVLFLVDPTTDLDFLIDTLRQSWEMMAVDSPNQAGTTGPIRIFRITMWTSVPVLEGMDSMMADRSTELEPTFRVADLTNPKKWGPRELDNMLRLILQGVFPET
jgi:hypothetical protein